MASRMITNDEAQQRTELLMDELEASRMEWLQNAQQYQQIKQKQLESEMVRLTEKSGANNVRVQKISTRLEYNKKFFDAMDMQIALTKRAAETFDPDGWRVQGMVSDDQNIPMPSLTVQLVLVSKEVNNNPFSATTDAWGIYSITIPKSTMTGLKEVKPVLRVIDSNGKLIFEDPRVLEPVAGAIDIEDIIIPVQIVPPIS